MIQFTAASKDNFFDRKAIEKYLTTAERKAFERIGGRLKVTAQRSMRSQKKPKKKAFVERPSAPGTPPRRRVAMGEGLTKIYYNYDKSQHGVVVGPVKSNWTAYSNVTVPQLHEFGGRVQIVEVDYSVTRNGWQLRGDPKWTQVGQRGQRNRGKRPMRVRTANYPKRPFMFPALTKNKQFIQDAWSSANLKGA